MLGFFFFGDMVLCTSDYEIVISPASVSVSWALGLQAYATIPQFIFILKSAFIHFVITLK